MIRHEIKRLFGSKLLYMSILAGIVSGALGLISYYADIYFLIQTENSNAVSSYEAWLYCLSVGSGSIYRVILPLLVTLPYVDSYLSDKKSGYLSFILSRTTYNKYLCAKLISIIFSSIVVVLSIFVAWFIIVSILFPSAVPYTDLNYLPHGIFSDLYPKLPYIYILAITFLNLLIGIGYSIIGLGLSTFLKNKFMVIAGPFGLYLALTLISQMIGINSLNPLVLVCPYELSISNSSMSIINLMITYSIAVSLIVLMKNRFHKEFV